MPQEQSSTMGTAKKSFVKGVSGTLGILGGVALCCFVLLIIIVVSQGSNTPTKVGDNTSNSNTSTGNNSQIFKVGDQVKIGDTTVTVNGIADNVDSGNQFIVPAEGKRYLAVDVKVDYSGTGSEYTSPLDFKLKDSDSYKYDSTYIEVKSPNLNGDNLKSGDSLRGWITFEIPTTSKGLQLIYQPGFFSSSQAVVDLGL